MDKNYLESCLADKMSIREIALKTEKSYTSVRFWLNKYGLKSNLKGGKRVENPVIKFEKPCLNCGNSTLNPKFCSRPCQHKHEWNMVKESVLNQDKDFQSYSESHKMRLIKKILLERGHVCSNCKGETWLGQPIPLILDHIDGDAENYSWINLRLVCGNCDMQLPTYKSKNKGKGRLSRKLRYHSDKERLFTAGVA